MGPAWQQFGVLCGGRRVEGGIAHLVTLGAHSEELEIRVIFYTSRSPELVVHRLPEVRGCARPSATGKEWF